MRLTLDQIKSITFGATQISQKSDGIYFSRFTDMQKKCFHDHHSQSYTNATFSTGICLDFHTDAKNFLIIPIRGKNYEVLVDGNPLFFFTGDHNCFRIAFTLPEGDKRVTVLFPHHSDAALMSMHIDNDAYLRPHKYDHKFLFLGDSIVQGHRSGRDCQSFASMTSRFFNAETMNLAVGGSRMDQYTLKKTDFNPDIILIGYGTNDYNTFQSAPIQDSAARDYFAKVNELYPSKKVFYISPIWRADHALKRDTGTLDECRDRLIKRANEAGFIHIDGYQLHPRCIEYLCDGYLHPNAQGFAFYTLNLIKAMLPYM